MHMEASVERVLLKFPLDLSLGGMLAVQDGDTLVNARELALSVQLLPLLDGNVELDDIHLYDAKINTLNLIEACQVSGSVGSLALVSHYTSLTEENALINHANLANADITVILNDSVPEDTTESGPVNWRIDLPDINVDNVTANLYFSGQHAMAHIGEGKACAYLDLGTGTYDIKNLKLKKSKAEYENFAIDIKNVETTVLVDSTSVSLPKFLAETGDSRFDIKGRMDFSAFDSINPGTFDLKTDAQIGWDDIRSVLFGFMDEKDAKDLNNTLSGILPRRPIQASIECRGNLQNLEVSKLNAYIERFAKLRSTASMNAGRVKADAILNAWEAAVKAKADYNMNNDAYDLFVDIRGLVANRIVSMGEHCSVSGTVKANGQGFDYLSKSMRVNADINLADARYGKMNLSSSHITAKMANGTANVSYVCNNEQLQTDLQLEADLGGALSNTSGKNIRESVKGKIALEMPKMDLCAMGLLDTAMVVNASGNVTLSAANWSGKHPQFNVAAKVNEIEIHTANDSLVTNRFDVNTFSTVDSTSFVATAGDLLVSFQAPDNIMDFMRKVDELSNVAMKQAKNRSVDFSILKDYMPTMQFKAEAGMNNPLIPLVGAYDMIFEDLKVDINTSSESGLAGNAHLYYMRYDSLALDSTYFNIMQDSTRLAYDAGIICQGHKKDPGFSAFLDGSMTMRDLDTHMRFYGPKGKQGIDLGVHGVITDTALNVKLYPEQPIIAFRQFDMNQDNYVQIPVVNHYIDPVGAPVLADIRLKSLSDDCSITLAGSATEDAKQRADLIIHNLNIENWLAILPFLPDMSGILNIDAFFDDTNSTSAIGAEVSAKDFTFEEMPIGNLHGLFNYMPEDEITHAVTGTVDYNDKSMMDLYGSYSDIADGILNADIYIHELPLDIGDVFIPDNLAKLSGSLAGEVNISGETSNLKCNGAIYTDNVQILSDPYSLYINVADDTISIEQNKIILNRMKLYTIGENPLTINGYYDLADFEHMGMAISLYGRELKLIEAKRSRESLLFGDVYGDIMCRVNGTMEDLTIRGLVNVLNRTNVTYILSDASISQGDRLDDIITFVDFSLPPDTTIVQPKPMGIDLNVTLNIEEGAKFNCEFSADRQSYVNVRGGGSINMLYTPEGIFNLVGRITMNEGEMKYTLPVIPLKTFKIVSGSYVEFNGNATNPHLNIQALVNTKASVSSAGSTARSVAFNVGLNITNTLDDMGLLFTLDAPSDGQIQSDLASYTDEEKNKLAVALLATGMYIADNNTSAITASSALNTFLQSEINNITGKALNSIVDISMGIDQTTYANGTTGTDYSFQFSKRFFSDRLSVIIGGRVSDNNTVNNSTGVGSFINDVSLEWRLDNSATRYVRLFHCKDYENVIDGELEKNGVGLVLRKKVDKVTDLFIFKKKDMAVTVNKNKTETRAAGNSGKSEKTSNQGETKASGKSRKSATTTATPTGKEVKL